MSDFDGLYSIRDGKESDNNFILATFLRGLYYGDSWFSLIPKDIFMDNYKEVAEHMVANNTIKIACLPEDPDVILGYSILSADFQTIHWVYVKSAWRKKGIGTRLTPKYPTTISHLSSLGKELMKRFDNCVFNPFKLD